MTLVSILGDFHSSILPISYEFKEDMVKHIIVYDDAKCDELEVNRIIKGQEAFFNTLPQNCKFKHETITLKIDEDSYVSMLGCLERIKQLSDEYGNIYLNATDGLSSIALVLSINLLSIGAKVIAYDRYANTYNLHTSNGLEKHSIRHNMDIKNHLLLKGYTLLEVASRERLNERKSVIYKLTKNLTRYKEFANILQKSSLNNIAGYDDYKELLHSIDAKDKKFIQGTVFEEYIYHLIVDNFDFDDVLTGVKVRFDEAVENEFDILMIKDNHLHTIECKLVNKLDGEYFVYKTELIMDYLDDDGKAMILSIGADNVRVISKKKKLTQFTLGDKARANYGDIKIHQSRVFNEKAFLNDVREWFL